MRELIKNKVEDLVKKYKTNDPFEIATCKHIKIYTEPLGSINGYYNKYVRERMIHINCDLAGYGKIFTCGHELGHAIFHPDSNTPFLRANTLFSVNKLEIEANTFSVFLTIPDELFLAYEGFTWEQISRAEGIPVQALKLRFMNLLR